MGNFNTYKRICSCCGYGIHSGQFEDNKIPEDNKDTEGNMCGRCYYEMIMSNWFQIKDMICMVTNAIKDPLKRFVFKHKTFEEQYHICDRLMEKGIITWKINR